MTEMQEFIALVILLYILLSGLHQIKQYLQDGALMIVMNQEPLDLQTVMKVVVEWRSVWVVYGVQCVIVDGTAMMPPQCADNWDTMTPVNFMKKSKIYAHIFLTLIVGIPTREAYFGEGSGPIHLSRAQCSNRDTNLTNCTIDKTRINGCDHSKDAGVICMGNG